MKTLLLLIPACLALSACKSSDKPATPPAEKEAPANVAADSFLILPGDYKQSTNLAELEARFGAANLRKEAGDEPRVVLFPNDPTRRAYITFHDREKHEQLASITVSDPDSRWRGKHGVHVGMPVAKVRELNGKPFYYSGFDSRQRAVAHGGWSPALEDDEKQPLGNFDVSEGDDLYFDLEFGISEPSKLTAPTDLPVDEHLSSDDPRFPKFKELTVVTAIISNSSLDDEW